MKKKRLIPVILIKNGWVVQSNNFKKYKNIGHPIPTIKRLSNFCSDEIIILDISKDDFYENRREDTNYNFREDIISILSEISQVVFMPVAVGGKIRNLTDARLRIEHGAEKIVINTMCINDKKEVEKISKSFGSQAIVASIDYKKVGDKYHVIQNGHKILSLDPIEHAKNLIGIGVGEIFLNSVDNDGLKKGYDIEYYKKFCEKIKLPIIGCGGAGEWEDMFKLSSQTKCDGIAAANIFHHVEHSVYLAKEYLSKKSDHFRSPEFYSDV
jgi:cyclase